MNTQKGRKSWPDEKLLSRALSARTSKAYWNNINELRRRVSASLYERCVALAKSDVPAERAAGVDILAQFYRNTGKRAEYPYREKALGLFLEMLGREKDTDTLISILHGIGHTNQNLKAGKIGTIVPFIHSEDTKVRFAAMSALSCLENMKAIRALITLSKDANSHIRDWATFALGTQSDIDNGEIRAALYARCTDKHHDTRMEAIYGLAKRKDNGVKKYLEKEFPACKVYVLISIQALNATEYLPWLEGLLKETEENPETGQYWLGHLKDCIDTLRNGSQAG